MSVRIGNRVFAPGFAGTAATVVLLPCMIALGLWQLQRADQKRALLTEYERGSAEVVDVRSGDALDGLPRYQRVRVHGHYESARQILLDNMPSQAGRPGYQVLTPFARDGAGPLLVNRGWVPLGATRAVLPDVPVDGHPRTLVGILDELPEPGLRLADPSTTAGGAAWPLVLNYPTHGRLRSLYGVDLCRYQLLLDPSVDDGYERAWHVRFGFGPQRHVGYAVQWFALAAALGAIYVAVNLRATHTRG